MQNKVSVSHHWENENEFTFNGDLKLKELPDQQISKAYEYSDYFFNVTH